jgi:hypothetical protein
MKEYGEVVVMLHVRIRDPLVLLQQICNKYISKKNLSAESRCVVFGERSTDMLHWWSEAAIPYPPGAHPRRPIASRLYSRFRRGSTCQEGTGKVQVQRLLWP